MISDAMGSGVTGKANFGFNAKYKNGKNNTNEVDGNTNFQFRAGDLHFKSSAHDDMSLVISGKKATYTGTGTVNGTGNHTFRLIAYDGDANGGGEPDKFRIRIWESNSDSSILYDNQINSSESSDDGTVLGGGSIVIHKPNGNGKGNKEQEDVVKEKTDGSLTQNKETDILEKLIVAPNPVVSSAEIQFSLKENASVVLRIFDANGREIDQLFTGAVKAEQLKTISFNRNNLMSGIYICKLSTDRGHSYNARIIVE